MLYFLLPDPTLTLYNVSAVFKGACVFWIHVFLRTHWPAGLDTRDVTDDERKISMITWWLKYSPFASWDEIMSCLFHCEADSVKPPVDIIKKYWKHKPGWYNLFVLTLQRGIGLYLYLSQYLVNG